MNTQLINELTELVSNATGIDSELFTSRCRKQHLVLCRQLVFTIAYKTFGMYYSQIGKAFASPPFDHTSVMHLVSNHESDYKFIQWYARAYDEVISKIDTTKTVRTLVQS